MRVRRGSAIQISYNTYSVSVRLIGEYVEARIGVEEIEVWYADTLVYPFPPVRCSSFPVHPSTVHCSLKMPFRAQKRR